MILFPVRMKEQRKHLKMTQSQLAEELGMSLHSIKKMETGRMAPSAETLMKLTKLFQCSADYLMGIDNKTEALLNDAVIKEYLKLPDEKKKIVDSIIKTLTDK